MAVCRPQDPFLIHFTASEDVIGVICFGKKGHESRLCLVLGEFVPAYILNKMKADRMLRPEESTVCRV